MSCQYKDISITFLMTGTCMLYQTTNIHIKLSMHKIKKYMCDNPVEITLLNV